VVEEWSTGVVEYWVVGFRSPLLYHSNTPPFQIFFSSLCYRPHRLSPFVFGFFIVGLEEYLMTIGTALYD
jgi:hypothetical protein